MAARTDTGCLTGLPLVWPRSIATSVSLTAWLTRPRGNVPAATSAAMSAMMSRSVCDSRRFHRVATSARARRYRWASSSAAASRCGSRPPEPLIEDSNEPRAAGGGGGSIGCSSGGSVVIRRQLLAGRSVRTCRSVVGDNLLAGCQFSV